MANIYVELSGNDNGLGTQASPYRNVSKAYSVAQPNDIVKVGVGVFEEANTRVIPLKVTTEGATKAGTVFKKTHTISFNNGDNDTDYTAMFQINQPQGSGLTGSDQYFKTCTLDGNSLQTPIGLVNAGVSRFKVDNVIFKDLYQCGYFLKGRNDNALDADGYKAKPVGAGAPNIWGQFNEVTNCDFINSSAHTILYGRGSLFFGGQDGLKIQNNFFDNSIRPDGYAGWGIKCQNNSGYMRNCIISGNRIVNRPFPYQGSYVPPRYWFEFSIELFRVDGGNIIENNVCDGAIDMNLQYRNVGTHSVIIRNNTIGFDVLPSGLATGIIQEFNTEDSLIENNVIKNCGMGIAYSLREGDYVNNTVIRNNLIRDIDLTQQHEAFGIGFITSDGSRSYTSNGLKIYNNTLICKPASQNLLVGFSWSGNRAASRIDNMEIINNIVMNFGININGAWYGSNLKDKTYTSIIRNNLLYNNGNSNDPVFSWLPQPNFDSSTVYTNNIKAIADPNLDANYIPQSGSQAIDAGFYVGIPFSGNAPDIGWKETGVVGNNPPVVNAGQNQSISLPANSITLTGSATDTDGSVVSVSWVKLSGASASIANPSALITQVTGLQQGEYAFRLTAIDNQGLSAYDDIIISVIQQNSPRIKVKRRYKIS